MFFPSVKLSSLCSFFEIRHVSNVLLLGDAVLRIDCLSHALTSWLSPIFDCALVPRVTPTQMYTILTILCLGILLAHHSAVPFAVQMENTIEMGSLAMLSVIAGKLSRVCAVEGVGAEPSNS